MSSSKLCRKLPVSRYCWLRLSVICGQRCLKAERILPGFDGRKNEFLFLSQGYNHEWHTNPQPAGLEKFQMFLGSVQPNVIHFHHFMTFGLEYLGRGPKASR